MNNDCNHRFVCKYYGDAMCVMECGHYSTEKLTSTNKPPTLKETISHVWKNVEVFNQESVVETHSFLIKALSK